MTEWRDSLADRYRLDEPLDAAEEETWRGTELASGEPVLIRFLKSLPAQRAGLLERLEALGQLPHPALVDQTFVRPGGGGVVLVRPWLAGEAGGAITVRPLEERLAAVIRLAEALHVAHGKGIVHGCLHSGNVLMDQRERLRVVDFGLPAAGGHVDGSWRSPQLRAGDVATPSDDLYALAALAHQWLCGEDAGRPAPVQARIDGLRQRREAGGEVPAALAMVLAQALAPDPGDRPESMLEFRERLEDARLAMRRAVETGAEETDGDWVVRPRSGPADTAPSEPAAERAGLSLPRIVIAVASVVAMMGLVMVLWVLPRQVEKEQAARRAEAQALAELAQRIAQEKAAEAARQAEAEQQPLSQEELERMLVLKQAAEEVLDAYALLRLDLEERGAAEWAPQAFAAAEAAKDDADEPFRQQEFEAAAAGYQAALGQLQALDGLADAVYAESLERGKLALDRGQSEAAAAAFEMAARLVPESQLAARGAQRASTLDQVNGLLEKAAGLEQSGDLAGALAARENAAGLDPLIEGIGEAIERTRRDLADRRFRQAMSDGLAAMEYEQWARARTSLEQARAMRPSDPAPRDALVQVERRIRESRIEHHRQVARDAVAAEAWSRAVEHFDAILADDGNLAFAQEGAERARNRAELDERLVSFLSAPERWWSDEGRRQAAELLADARLVESPGPRLREQLQGLSAQLELARRPVDVTLVSDNACNVVVYKVARLGQFDRHHLKLQPGRYTAVGTRDGYRDVRKEFVVHALRGADPVVVRCEEEV